jgi:hypothetical protein
MTGWDLVVVAKEKKKIEVSNATSMEEQQAHNRPKVFGCTQIISLLNTEQNHLTRLPAALPMRNVCRANVADPMRYLVRSQTCCVSLYLLSTTRLAMVDSAFLSSVWTLY